MFGTVKNEGGMLFSGNNFKVVKKVLKSGEQIPSHNHESDNIVLSVLKGKMEMNDKKIIKFPKTITDYVLQKNNKSLCRQ